MTKNNISQPRVVAVCRSALKGTKKVNVIQGELLDNHGLIGDSHAENGTHRQISLLAIESIQKMRDLDLDVNPGDFAENITTKGISLKDLEIGTKMSIGKQSIVQVTQIGKNCHRPCEIGRQVGDCIMPTEGIFCRVIEGGKIKVGDELHLIN